MESFHRQGPHHYFTIYLAKFHSSEEGLQQKADERKAVEVVLDDSAAKCPQVAMTNLLRQLKKRILSVVWPNADKKKKKKKHIRKVGRDSILRD